MIGGSINEQIFMIPKRRLNNKFLLNCRNDLKCMICDSNRVLTDNGYFIKSINNVFDMSLFKCDLC